MRGDEGHAVDVDLLLQQRIQIRQGRLGGQLLQLALHALVFVLKMFNPPFQLGRRYAEFTRQALEQNVLIVHSFPGARSADRLNAAHS